MQSGGFSMLNRTRASVRNRAAQIEFASATTKKPAITIPSPAAICRTPASMVVLPLHIPMAVVAKRRRLGTLASAELHRAVPRRLPFHRLEDRTLMRAVTEGLALGATATAP